MSLSGCVHGDDLGGRAAAAARRGDLEALDRLMRRARARRPDAPLGAPERTVFTHFLDLAGTPGFEAHLARWRAKGWVPADQACALERARYRGHRAEAPGRALEAARRAVALARAATEVPARDWVLKACLRRAPFLREDRVRALEPWLEIVSSPIEPAPLRQAILHGLTERYLQDPVRRRQSSPAPSAAEARAAARAELEAERRRFLAIVEAAELAADLPTLVRGAAWGALELERAAGAVDASVFATIAGPGAPADRATLVDGWISHARAGPPIPRLAPLGLWRGEAAPSRRWYACAGEEDGAEVFSADAQLDSATVRGRCAGARPLGPARLRYSLEARLRGWRRR